MKNATRIWIVVINVNLFAIQENVNVRLKNIKYFHVEIIK